MFVEWSSTKHIILVQTSHFGCYSNFKFPLAYNGKNENWHLLLFHCRYFDKSFLEMFVEWSSTKYTFLSKTLNLICCHGNQKVKFAKNIKKINSSEAIWGIKLKLCRNVHSISLYKLFLLMLHIHWLLWQLSFHRLIMGQMKIGFNCSTKYKVLMQITHFDLLPLQLKD